MIDSPDRTEPHALQRYAPAAVALLMLVFFGQAYFSSLQKSLSFDEPLNLGGGYGIMAWGEYELYHESPPLMQLLSGWGLYSMRPIEPPEAFWRGAGNPKMALGVELTFRGGVDHIRVTKLARLPVLLMGTLLIGLIYAWGNRLLGVPSALVVTLLAAFSPNLIAHSRTATADLGCTLFMFGAVAAFWWAARTGALGRWFACGAITGLALITKFTSLLLGPTYVLLVGAVWLTRPETRSVRWVARAAIPIAVMSWLVIAVTYGFDLDLSMYRTGVGELYSDLSGIYYNYLLGVPSQAPFWYYNIVAYVLKVPTAVLLLLLFATVATVGKLRKRVGRAPEDSETPRELFDLENVPFLLIPAAVVVAASFFDKTNIGLRRILPAFPFLLLYAGYAVRAVESRGTRAARGTRGMQAIVAALVVWAVAVGVRIYPHHLSFFNMVSGGPEQGPYLLDDSNIDWGQDLPALAEWQSTRPADEELRIQFFGTAYGPAYGVRGVRFDLADQIDPRPGVYAMSVHELTGFRKQIVHGSPGVDWLTEFEPIARAGYSIYIYEFR